MRLRVARGSAGELAAGDSVAVNGVCLTAREPTAGGFAADVMAETLRAQLARPARARATAVNLELPLRAGDRLGGHIVQGHVDGVGHGRVAWREEGFARVVRDRRAAPDLLRYVVEKGSVAVDGVSLTVAAVDDDGFSVSLIPETLERTTLGAAGARGAGEPGGGRDGQVRREAAWRGRDGGVSELAVQHDRGGDRGHPRGQDGRGLRRRGPRERGRPHARRRSSPRPRRSTSWPRTARGLICLALTPERCDELGLDLMAAKNESAFETAFTVSIEAREGITTGISAHDRAAHDPGGDRPGARPAATSCSPATSSR